ncbi:MAG: TetR/AcrR family transcriptional regulator [Gemmataceae bacterium]|nr:TetR/AcrR family transcriptional regulator [Gemmataceae bacterium]
MTRVADDRRKQILAAAERCFARHGFHQTSMQEVCREAGLSPGSVYRYFRSKDDIIVAMAGENRQSTHERFSRAADHPDAVAGLILLAEEVLGEINDPACGPLFFECTAEAMRNPRVAEVVRRDDREIVAGMEELIRRGQGAGQIDPTLDPRRAAETLIALADGLTWRKFLDPQLDLAAFRDTARLMIERFLRPT